RTAGINPIVLPHPGGFRQRILHFRHDDVPNVTGIMLAPGGQSSPVSSTRQGNPATGTGCAPQRSVGGPGGAKVSGTDAVNGRVRFVGHIVLVGIAAGRHYRGGTGPLIQPGGDHPGVAHPRSALKSVTDQGSAGVIVDGDGPAPAAATIE